MRRKRHQTSSKIINRLNPNGLSEVGSHQSGVFHPCIDLLIHLATDLIDHLHACLR